MATNTKTGGVQLLHKGHECRKKKWYGKIESPEDCMPKIQSQGAFCNQGYFNYHPERKWCGCVQPNVDCHLRDFYTPKDNVDLYSFGRAAEAEVGAFKSDIYEKVNYALDSKIVMFVLGVFIAIGFWTIQQFCYRASDNSKNVDTKNDNLLKELVEEEI